MKKRWLAIAVLTALLMVIGGTTATACILWRRTSGPQAAATPSGQRSGR